MNILQWFLEHEGKCVGDATEILHAAHSIYLIRQKKNENDNNDDDDDDADDTYSIRI